MENWGLGKLIAATLATLAVLAGIIVTIYFYSDRYECSAVSRNTGVHTKFVKNHLFSWDCFVAVDGGWIPIGKWRGVSTDTDK